MKEDAGGLLGFRLLGDGLLWHIGGTCCLLFEGDCLAPVDAEAIGRKEVYWKVKKGCGLYKVSGN